MKKVYVAPKMEIEIIEGLPLCIISGSGGGVDVDFGGDATPDTEPAANIRRDFEEALEGLLW